VKFYHPPHLYCVITIPSKTNTTANIGVKCLHFSRNVMLSVGVWGRQGWSSSILERKLTAHTAISSSRRVCCLPSEHMSSLQVDTAVGWSASAHRPDHDGLSEKKSTSTSLNLTYGLQIPLILIPWIMLLRVLFSNESTTNDNSRRWKN